MSSKSQLHPAGKDFVIKQLLNYSWRRVYFILGVIFFLSFLPIVISFIEGDFINKNLTIDAYRDISYHVMFILLLPFYIFFLRYYLTGLENAIDSLRNSNILKIDVIEYNNAVKYSNNFFASWFVTLLPFFLATIFLIDSIFNYNLKALNTWNSTSLEGINLLCIINIFNTFLFFYFFFALLIRMSLIYFIIKKFLYGNLNVQPLHPDNCGGLSPISKFALKISWAGIFGGIAVLLLMYGNYRNNIPHYQLTNVMNLVSYIIAMTIAFFLPLFGARESMLRKRYDEMNSINIVIQNERENIFLDINKFGITKEIDISNLENLIKLQDVAKSMPVWPFNSKSILKFLSSVLWPVLLVFLQYIVGTF
jgi:hypothetical protein